MYANTAFVMRPSGRRMRTGPLSMCVLGALAIFVTYLGHALGLHYRIRFGSPYAEPCTGVLDDSVRAYACEDALRPKLKSLQRSQVSAGMTPQRMR